jgi:site-specific recombinase XerD
MGMLRERMLAEMRALDFSRSTIRSYLSAARRFAEHFGRSPLALGQEDCAAYFRYLAEIGASPSRIWITHSAIKFLYRIFGREDATDLVRLPRRKSKLPAVMGRAEVQAVFEQCRDKRYKALFALIYSAGLRISEALALQVGDIDFERRQIFVRAGKNSKDRYSILGVKAADCLRAYMRAYRPVGQLFYARRDRLKPLCKRSAQSAFRILALRAGIGKQVHVHTLRHSFATHLLEDGVNIFYIMRLLGHSSIKTTQIYLHMRRLDDLDIKSPIDAPEMDLERGPSDPDGQFLLPLAS